MCTCVFVCVRVGGGSCGGGGGVGKRAGITRFK